MSSPQSTPIDWQLKRFSELSAQTMHDMLRLRQDVFVVEQNCPYPDIDGTDHEWLHLLGYQQGELVAYARLRLREAEQAQEPQARIGRVLVAEKARGQALGRALMVEAMAHIHSMHPKRPIILGAQCYLLAFYRSLGFQSVGGEYLEDGIPHQDMEWRA